MTARQGELLPRPPRRTRGQLMDIVDARHDERATVALQCPKCGHNTGWLRFETVTEAKRRLPCPICIGHIAMIWLCFSHWGFHQIDIDLASMLPIGCSWAGYSDE